MPFQAAFYEDERLRPLQNLRFERISKIASHHVQRILKYFQVLEKRVAKKWAKDEDFTKVSDCLKGVKGCLKNGWVC